MESLKELYRIGHGPSSSHTLGVERACSLFKNAYPEADKYEVRFFDSLSLTGKGHFSDKVAYDTLSPQEVIVEFAGVRNAKYATNLQITAYKEGNKLDSWDIYSIGGGAIDVEGRDFGYRNSVFPHATFQDIKSYLKQNNLTLVEYVKKFDLSIHLYLKEIAQQMIKTVATGLLASGKLPGTLKLDRIAKKVNADAQKINDPAVKVKMLLSSYAYSASEENAGNGICVTAPTLGASGVMAAIVYHFYHDLNYNLDQIAEGLMVAGIFGNLIKKNASISGAMGGCQAEIGSACAMGSAFIAYLDGLSLAEIEYAAEVGVEHHLGLTCDPIEGYVMIPCIERNVVATLRSFDNATLVKYVNSHQSNYVSFDDVVRVMDYTGCKIALELRETSLGGLATEVSLEKFNRGGNC